ncbi:hypothetical protein CDAR_299941 [Caerostris darwini]|uniref:Uncharacterized protein n=1 Tax=Caerostris darwini TaxID=1538125 RepID=A0AAV4W383_9ARAC|nr:hypothetical protein CDAR_299941 [Caerostris darwini]
MKNGVSSEREHQETIKIFANKVQLQKLCKILKQIAHKLQKGSNRRCLITRNAGFEHFPFFFSYLLLRRLAAVINLQQTPQSKSSRKQNFCKSAHSRRGASAYICVHAQLGAPKQDRVSCSLSLSAFPKTFKACY